ncbi:DUF433 domain-containing protein [Streptomyces sp.]|uniref:DUF433 domain-containing protein n=1 Tax=Streptomyces sp. TaxID=1931 RepID=UPI002F426B58
MPFVAVAEAYVLRSLRGLGLRMTEVREAAGAVRDAFDTPYGLVSRRIATDGVDIFVEHGLGDLRRARDGQAPIHEVVAQYLQYLSWDAGDDFPSSLRLRQYGDVVPVVIDPRFGHGLPVVAANRVPVKAVTDLWEAGETVEDIAYEYDMEPDQVDELCQAVVRQGRPGRLRRARGRNRPDLALTGNAPTITGAAYQAGGSVRPG